MAIERVLKAEFVLRRDRVDECLKILEKEKILHIDDLHHDLEPEQKLWELPDAHDTRESDGRISRAQRLLSIFQEVSPTEKGLLEGFFGSPPYVTGEVFESKRGEHSFDAEEGRISAAYEEYKKLDTEVEVLKERIAGLEPWKDMSLEPALLRGFRHFAVVPVAGSPKKFELLEKDRNTENSFLQTISEDKKKRTSLLVVEKDSLAEADAWILSARLDKPNLPVVKGSVGRELEALTRRLDEVQPRIETLREGLKNDADVFRGWVRAVLDEAENSKKNILVHGRLFSAGTVKVLSGWIIERDRARLEKAFAPFEAHGVLRISPPTREDAPPVRLKNPRIFKPFELLVDMFGVPAYFGVDPTPFVAIAMTLFYAMCFGDAGYGALQVLMMVGLLKKFKPAEGTRKFLNIFIVTGTASIVFGILTWSFFGFAPGYTYGGPKILGIFPLIVPTTDILPIMLVSVIIGAVFQLVAIGLGFVNNLKKGDIKAAVFDNLCWLLFVIFGPLAVWFLIGLGGSLVFPLPGWAGIAFCVPAAASLLGIVLFSGRDDKNWVSRILTGVIALYGIVGYYGLVGFFSDVLSYMRLSILNLTGGFISTVAQITGDLVWSQESLHSNIVLFLLTGLGGLVVLVALNVLNLFMSMLGSFVHSLRLNYLESFSRFPFLGGRKFAPHRKEARFHRFEQ